MAKATKDTPVTDLVKVRPSQAAPLIKQCMLSKRPVMVWGPPGIGKSDLIQQIADTFAKKDKDGNAIGTGRKVIDIRLILMDPTDLKGIPYFDSNEGRMKWAPTAELPQITTQEDVDQLTMEYNHAVDRLASYKTREDSAIKGGAHDLESTLIKVIRECTVAVEVSRSKMARAIDNFSKQDAIIFLDELVSAPPAVQGSAYQLMLNRRIGEYILPPGCDIVAAGNREGDRGITHQMPKPLQNRLIHLELTDSFEDWQKWAVNNRVNPDVIGYLSAHNQDMFNFDPKSPSKAFATPRSWKFVSDLISANNSMSLETLHPLIAGTVGDGVAYKFLAHLKVAKDMPNPRDVLEGREKKMKVADLSAKYSLTISMCYALRDMAAIAKENEKSGKSKKDKAAYDTVGWHVFADNFLGFMMDNFEPEMCILGAKTALQDYGLEMEHKLLKNFSTFFDKYGKLILAA